MPRMTRVISSELIIARSGHTTHNAQEPATAVSTAMITLSRVAQLNWFMIVLG